MSIIFLVVRNQHQQLQESKSNRSKGQRDHAEDSGNYQDQVDDLLLDEEPETVIAQYAEKLAQKFQRLAGCLDEEGNHDQQNEVNSKFQIDEDKVNFEEVLFMRILFEYSKFSRS